MAIDFTVLQGLSIERLRTFCEIVDAGSVVAAAGRNPIKQSQFSRQIRVLEQTLETKLFVREGRRLKLTTDGVKLAALTAAYFGALGEFRSGEGGGHKPMKLGSAESIARWVLAPRFPEVLTAAGAGGVDVETHRTASIVERIDSGQLDVGIIRADASNDTLETLPFQTLRYVLMVPRSKLPDKSAAGIHESGAFPFVMLSGDGRFVKSVERLAVASELELQIQARVEAFSLAVEIAKVMDAATIVPRQAQSEFPKAQYAPVNVDGIEAMDRRLIVVYGRKTAELNSRARRFAMRLSRVFENSAFDSSAP